MESIVNILYHKWKGYYPLYWRNKDSYYFTYYNINNIKYPENHPGYRIIQKIRWDHSSYQVTNKILNDNLPIEEDKVIHELPYRKYICKPIGYGELFVYRIHLLITPPSSFFDSFQHGYFIRNHPSSFIPKSYYDPFTFSILRENSFVYVDKDQSIIDRVDFKNFPYVARDFLIKSQDIDIFIDYMKQVGWKSEQTILTQRDIFVQLEEIDERLTTLKKIYKNKEIKDHYIDKLFNQKHIKGVQRLIGQLYINIHDICNTYLVLWDEALELKNIFRKYPHLVSSNGITLDRINGIYNSINHMALDEISKKHKLLDYLLHMIKWKMDHIKGYPDHNPLKEWILTAIEPFLIFANQLDIWNEHSASYQAANYAKYLTFNDDKYKISFDSKILISPRRDQKNKTTQEELKMLIEEYKRKPNGYTKRRIQKELESLKTSLKIIDEIQRLLS